MTCAQENVLLHILKYISLIKVVWIKNVAKLVMMANIKICWITTWKLEHTLLVFFSSRWNCKYFLNLVSFKLRQKDNDRHSMIQCTLKYHCNWQNECIDTKPRLVFPNKLFLKKCFSLQMFVFLRKILLCLHFHYQDSIWPLLILNRNTQFMCFGEENNGIWGYVT